MASEPTAQLSQAQSPSTWQKKINAPYERTGLPYFARPHKKTVIVPIIDSPVLEQVGVKLRFGKEETMEQWVKAKQTLQLNPGIAAKRWAERGDGNIRGACRLSDRKYKE
ncbi:hypothetical protein G647_05569 [Cladophialophora carrionii CBS 160.54]|uniref:Uncharacterized protein n=1 Tax=Cladophialophora carrionii CBS 160.54 TaxID=1279043 RepID=V9DBS4_9EURO|nr:uncharacterized protein G647_05569 [Cladophialophora carrionii CBS 160.54]ETI23763.1 hypothetical protein G647_05569 [Cladophialophora carrionii CBS 160.54]